MRKGFVIAIDGPAAAGKGTIAPRLAKKLSGFYLYTGAMYRCLALAAHHKNISYDNKSLITLLNKIKIDLKEKKVFLDGKDVTEAIKDQNIAYESSKIAEIAQVRERMVKLQRNIGEREINKGKIVVAEGRDTGTKVFPNAKLKVFLTADSKVRAERRLEQLKIRGVSTSTFEKTLKEVKNRDKRDTQRKIDPLVSNPKKYGYFVLDNSDLTEDETLEAILNKLND